ncbi:tail fiber domain-containing protein, partial [Aureibacter tunicatorum]
AIADLVGDINTDDQNLTLSGSTLSIEDGNDVDLSSINTDDQQLTYDASTQVVTLENGGTVDLSALLDNTDAQQISYDAANQVINLSNGGQIAIADLVGDINTDDQQLTYDAATQVVTLENGGTVDLSALLDNTDAQQISYDAANQVINLSNGGQIAIADLVGDINTDDQQLTYDAATQVVTLENGGTVDLSALLDNTDAQQISYDAANQVINLSNGGQIAIADLVGDINTDDQNLTLSGSTLSIEDGNDVDLSSINTDNQIIDQFSLVNNELRISLENDGEVAKTVDLSTLDNSDLSQDHIFIGDINGKAAEVAYYQTHFKIDPSQGFKLKEQSISGSLIQSQAVKPSKVYANYAEIYVGTDNNYMDDILLDLNVFDLDTVNKVLSLDASIMNDNDTDPTNELQDFVITGNTLSISGSGTSLSFDNSHFDLNANTISIKDAAISTGKIQDDAVEPEKISSGSSGQVLTTNSSGDVVWKDPSSTDISNAKFKLNDKGFTVYHGDESGAFNGTSNFTLNDDHEIHGDTRYNGNQLLKRTTGELNYGSTSAYNDRFGYYSISQYGRLHMYGYDGIYLDGGLSGIYLNSTQIYTSGSWWRASDKRLKKDIHSIESALEKVLKLNGMSYHWKKSDEHEYGLIAQEVEEILPKLVSVNPDGFKSVNYTGIIPFLIEAIKKQQTIIEDLTMKLAKGETDIESLKSALEFQAKSMKLQSKLIDKLSSENKGMKSDIELIKQQLQISGK